MRTAFSQQRAPGKARIYVVHSFIHSFDKRAGIYLRKTQRVMGLSWAIMVVAEKNTDGLASRNSLTILEDSPIPRIVEAEPEDTRASRAWPSAICLLHNSALLVIQ
jgi:hypothetical protein